MKFAQRPKTPQQAALAKSATIGRSHLGQSRNVNSILQRLPEAGAEEFAAGSAATASTGFGHDFSAIRVHAPAAESIQTKLAINRPGDAYEQEADRAAAKVMNLSSPETVHRKEAGLGPGIAPPMVHDVLGSPGQPLDPATRAFMEPRFGQDFSRVRVHTDRRAASSARAIDALAYTAGENIVFGSGQHRPDTWNGRHLLAHELTHVVQQARQPARMIYRKATAKDEADKVVAVKEHTEQQRRVVQYLSNALKIKPNPAKGPLDPDNLYHNTAQLVDPPKTAKAALKVLTPTHYMGPNNLMYFDSRVAHPQIQGDYPADPLAVDAGLVLQPGAGTLGQTDVLPSQTTGSSTSTTPKEEHSPGRVDPTFTGKEPMPKPVTDPDKTKTPAKPSTPPVIAWSAAEIKLFLGRPAVSEAELKSTFVHEGQHVADWIYLKERKSGNWQQMLELYKSEFRAFWIQPPGGFTFPAANPIGTSVAKASLGIAGGQGCDVCGGSPTPAKGTAPAPPPPPQPIGMKNERQDKIFFHLLSAYPQNHFDCLYVCNKDFRDGVDAYDTPAGTNLANSTRLIDLSIELQKLTPASTSTQVGQTKFQSAIEHLDPVDWAFLKDKSLSKPFWDSAQAFAPEPVYEALDALAAKGKPAQKEIRKALEKALAKLKAP